MTRKLLPKVTVVIVTYQSRKTIKSTLNALKRAYDNKIADVVIVDNDSMDGTVDFIINNYPWAKVIRNTENVGFARGCNYGSKNVKTPYLMFLNPDAVIELESIKILLNFMDYNPRAGICGPIFDNLSGQIPPLPLLPTPFRIIANPVFGKFLTKKQKYIYPGGMPVLSEWLRGACLLLQTQIFENIGGFDPRFFLYFEETDLCLRIRQSHYEIWIVGKASCNHIVAASAKETGSSLIYGNSISEHYYKSRFYYLVKHFGWFLAVSVEIGEILFMFIRAFIKLIQRKENKELLLRVHSPILKLPARIEDKEG